MSTINMCSTGRSVVLSGCSELGLDSADEMTRLLNIALIKREPVAVDLRHVSHMDSAILSCLHVLGRALDRRGQRLRISVTRGTQPETLLHHSGFSSWLESVSDDQLALPARREERGTEMEGVL